MTTTTAPFSISDALRFGWQTFTKNLGFFIKLAAIMVVLYLVLGVLQKMVEDSGLLSLLVTVLSWVVELTVAIGMTKIVLKFYDGQPPAVSDLWQHYRLLVPYAVGAVLYGLLITVGFILLIISGVYWALTYWLVPYLIVDHRSKPLEAFKESARLTKGIKGQLLVFMLVSVGVVILGVLAVFVGLLVAIPVITLAQGYVYRKLLIRMEIVPATANTPTPLI